MMQATTNTNTKSHAKKPIKRRVDGVLILDKPLGLSSNGALQVVKRLFSAKKAGHTGSLDPLATGVLPICFGKATKLADKFLTSDKKYCKFCHSINVNVFLYD